MQQCCIQVKRRNFRVAVSLNSGEELVRQGEKIKHLLIAYFLCNVSAKNYQNRLMYVKVIAGQ